MRKLIYLIFAMLAVPCMAQSPLFFQSAFNVSGGTQAAAPTFSPAAGTYSSTQSVTASTTTSACSAYIYTGQTNPPTTLSSTFTVSASGTWYAYVHGCPGYTDSTVASAAYTISGGGGPTSTNGCSGYSGLSASLTCAFTSSVGSSDLPVLAVSSDTTSLTATASGCGATWTSYTQAADVGSFILITGASPTAGSCTVSITLSSGAGYNNVTGADVVGSTGMDGSPVFLSNAGSAGFISGAAITTTHANDLVLSFWADTAVNGGSSSYTAGSGTILIQANYGAAVQYQAAASAGALTPTITYANSGHVQAETVAFHP